MVEPTAWLYEHEDGRSEVHLFRLVGPPLGWTETPLYGPEALEKVAQAAIDASAEVSCRFDQLGNCYDAIRALSPKAIVEGVK